ncbi:hypothetical protein CcaverHIS002_0306250 [Cutaneotrichosporon cavernicola]|nr:hypothetical protein CcaverHIS002_0306250 [Cutaneotrichosporon cavernicola]
MPFPLEVCIDSLGRRTRCGAPPPPRRPLRSVQLAAGWRWTYSKELMPEIKLMVMIRPRPGSTFGRSKSRGRTVSSLAVYCATATWTSQPQRGSPKPPTRYPLPSTARSTSPPDWHAALEDIANIPGITRILTSGHMATALDGAAELRQLANFAPAHLSILPASGINAITLPRVLQIVPLHEAHLSAGGIYTPPTDPTGARGEVLGFGRSEWRLDPAKLAAVRDWVDKNT